VIVRTVRGDVRPAELGPCDAHEHLFLETPLQPDEGFGDVRRSTQEAAALAAAGAAALVDWTPLGLGRSLPGLRAVSEATGLHVVAATGLHRDAHYVAEDPWRSASAAEMADRFTAEVREGGCGLVKAGGSYHRVTPFEAAVLDAAAETRRRTGAPVGIHAEHGTNGFDLLARAGGEAILAHLDRNPDPGEHAELAAAGAWLQYDGPGRAKYHPDSTILALIAAVADRGWAHRVLLGGDCGRALMLRAYGGGPGMDYLFARFKPRVERELGADLSQRIFVENPARAFAFAPR
jgi:5-phospho-D-xylono-1,4-lactonase